MAVSNQSATIFRGTDATIIVTMLTPPAGGCAGWTVVLTLRNPFTGVSTTIPGTVTDTVNGVFSFPDPRTSTLAQAAGLVNFSVDRTDSGADDHIADGNFIFTSTSRDP